MQTDGQMKTGRDVVIAALLGAEEIGFSTAPLITMGCIMMRACHLNTCPVGIATQDPELRKRFQGKPEHVVNFFFFVAEEVRKYMAQLGIRKFEDLVGRTDLLEANAAIDHWKARGVDLTHLLADAGRSRRRCRAAACARRTRCSTTTCDHELIEKAKAAPRERRARRDRGGSASEQAPLRRRHAVAARSPAATARTACRTTRSSCTLRGPAGQSFGGWLSRGVTLPLEGDANDYTGKGMSGGVLAVRAARRAPRSWPRRT